MRLKSIELSGFKSFAKKTQLDFASAITAVVGPNGSGKSNIAESFRFVLGEQSMKSMRGRRGEDMIWNGGHTSPRAGRAGVKLIFDNSDRRVGLDFDEVVIERVVHRDGGNDYLLNGSQVRLRDIAELLSQANIGSTGHHIISQGEADRVISASPRERREMIEDALGLTAYLYKREEAQRKLAKAAENMHEVESLRRELAPHLKFLGAQVKKIEETQVMREALAGQYAEYLKREDTYISLTKAELEDALAGPTAERHMLDMQIAHLRRELEAKDKTDEGTHELMELERAGRTARERRESITRELGRIEGELAAQQRIAASVAENIPVGQVQEFAQRVEKELAGALELEEKTLRVRLASLLAVSREFLHKISHGESPKEDNTEALGAKKAALEKELEELHKKEEDVRKEVEALRRRIEDKKDASLEAQRELFSSLARRSELETILASLHAREEALARDTAGFKEEFAEAGALLGHAALDYETYVVREANGEEVSEMEIAEEPRIKQEERRRKLERAKIKLEEVGAGNSEEILKEHTEVLERDAFLARELEDLERSMEQLHQLIADLSDTLKSRFEEGIEKINTQFDEFFKLMFGGGGAALAIVKEKKLRPAFLSSEEEPLLDTIDEDEGIEVEEGVEMSVNLPHKKVKGLHMLSGGERALTSIALIFAMSQVNPPPFLILDETDAALDEANSRRYSDMIENLARKSQLILITHNRETMSRAGILYGVTMGSDGVSKLLSVKFEEAVAVAK